MANRVSAATVLRGWPELREQPAHRRRRLRRLIVLLVAILITIVLTLKGFSSPVQAVDDQAGLLAGSELPIESGASSILGRAPSCSMPSNEEERQRCQLLEDSLLMATVRFVVRTWRFEPGDKGYSIASTVGHGTVKDGRFLVTHNHFDTALSLFSPAGEKAVYTRIFIYDASGSLLYDGPMDQVSVAAEGAQMLVLDFGDRDGRPFFEALGFASADFLYSAGLALLPGTEVAQVDWDGACSRIEWTTVEEVETTGDIPHLHLFDPILAGASGGGVFCNGTHVANNWTRLAYLDRDDHLLGERSIAALNSLFDSERRGSTPGLKQAPNR